MAERKKRGLGRGLGALIPDAATSDRPVDVFFSGGSAEEQSRGSAPAEDSKSTRTRRTDPAASMQSSRRRKPKADATETSSAGGSRKGGTKASAATTSAAKGAAKAGTAAESGTGATVGTSAKSGAAKSASKSSGAKTGGAKTESTAKSSSAKSSTRKASTAKSSGAKTGTAKTATPKTATSKVPASADKRTAVKPAPVSDSANDESAVVDEQTTVPSVAPDDVAGSSASSASVESSASIGDSRSIDDVETADDVREQHPGVYTSKGGSLDDDDADVDATEPVDETIDQSEKQVEATDTTEVVNSTGGSSNDGPEFDDGPGMDSIPDTAFGEIEVELIDPNPRQPRTVFDEDQLAELVHSIREIGVLQPVVVRRKPGADERYELIMGERRLRATKEAGLATIPAIVRFVDDTDLLRDALLENLHRAELNPLEEAAAYGQLLEDFNCTQEELSERIGRSRPQISNTLRLLRLPPLVQRRMAAGVISAGHARAILGLKDPEQMEVLAQRIVAEGLSVRASEEAVVLLNRGDSVNVSRATSRVAPEFIEVAERLGDRLDTKVNITVGKRKGKLSVEFANQEDLDRILSLLGVKSTE